MAAVVVAVTFVAVWTVPGAVNRYSRKRLHPNARVLVFHAVRVAILLLGAVSVLPLFGLATPAWLTAGAVGATVALAMQQVASNAIAGVYLLMEGRINVGDVISVAGQTGRVDDVGVRTTTLVNAAGDHVMIPSEDVFGGEVVVLSTASVAALESPDAQEKSG